MKKIMHIVTETLKAIGCVLLYCLFTLFLEATIRRAGVRLSFPMSIFLFSAYSSGIVLVIGYFVMKKSAKTVIENIHAMFKNKKVIRVFIIAFIAVLSFMFFVSNIAPHGS